MIHGKFIDDLGFHWASIYAREFVHDQLHFAIHFFAIFNLLNK